MTNNNSDAIGIATPGRKTCIKAACFVVEIAVMRIHVNQYMGTVIPCCDEKLDVLQSYETGSKWLIGTVSQSLIQ